MVILPGCSLETEFQIPDKVADKAVAASFVYTVWALWLAPSPGCIYECMYSIFGVLFQTAGVGGRQMSKVRKEIGEKLQLFHTPRDTNFTGNSKNIMWIFGWPPNNLTVCICYICNTYVAMTLDSTVLKYLKWFFYLYLIFLHMHANINKMLKLGISCLEYFFSLTLF